MKCTRWVDEGRGARDWCMSMSSSGARDGCTRLEMHTLGARAVEVHAMGARAVEVHAVGARAVEVHTMGARAVGTRDCAVVQ